MRTLAHTHRCAINAWHEHSTHLILRIFLVCTTSIHKSQNPKATERQLKRRTESVFASNLLTVWWSYVHFFAEVDNGFHPALSRTSTFLSVLSQNSHIGRKDIIGYQFWKYNINIRPICDLLYVMKAPNETDMSMKMKSLVAGHIRSKEQYCYVIYWLSLFSSVSKSCIEKLPTLHDGTVIEATIDHSSLVSHWSSSRHATRRWRSTQGKLK